MAFSSESLRSQLPCINEVKRYVVAYSGGLDSHVLLFALAQLRDQFNLFPPVEALHIHHGVSDQADDWVDHCESVCQKLSVGFSIRYVEPHVSDENTLRKLRYGAFEAYSEEGDVFLLAHHADDQVETIMFRMLRGSGAKGVAGIASQRVLGEGQLQRPLLAHTRSELEAFANRKNLSWIEDKSNNNTDYDRNFLRHQVTPKLAERWPHYRRSMLRFAEINRQLQHSVDYFVARELSNGLDGQCLIIEWLNSHDQSVQIQLLRAWLQWLNLPIPGYEQICRIRTEVVDAVDDAQPVLSWPGGEVRRFRDKLYAMSPLPVHPREESYTWEMTEKLVTPSIGELTAKMMVGKRRLKPILAKKTLNVCFRQGGERCHPVGRGGSHPLKKLLQEYKVPPWLRDRVPLIYDGETLVAVADLWVCEGFQADELEQGLCIRWLHP